VNKLFVVLFGMPFELHPWAWSPDVPFRGYQGMDPLNEHVQCVFLGKDANFPTDEELHAKPHESSWLSQYLSDPNAFFQENENIHHPFRHPEWNIPGHDGGKYHRRLARLLEDAAVQPSRISILELLRLPTIGNSGRCQLFKQAVSGQMPPHNGQAAHLEFIDKLLCTQRKRVFVFRGFGGLWHSFSNDQQELIRTSAPRLADLGEWFGLPRAVGAPKPDSIIAEVFVHTHFSDAISNAEIGAIAEIIRG
jgi:hypothetical protein